MKRRIIFIFSLFLVVTCSIYAEYMAAAGSFFPWQKTEKVFFRIGYLPLDGSRTFLQRIDSGELAKRNLVLEMVPFVSAREMERSLLEERIDGQIGDLLELAKLNEKGFKVRAVASYEADDSRIALLASPASDICDVSGIRNIPVAVDHDTLGEYVLDQMRLRYSIPKNELKEVLIRPLCFRLELLIDGKVKAAVLPEPFASQALKRGALLLAETNKEQTFSQEVLIFRENSLNKKGEGVKRLLSLYDLSLPSREEMNRLLLWLKEQGMIEQKTVYEDLVKEEYLKKKKFFKIF